MQQARGQQLHLALLLQVTRWRSSPIIHYIIGLG
jgi:hypothetical protein